MKHIRWKLLMRSLFSVFLLEKSEVKLTLIRKRLEMLGKDVDGSRIEKAVDEPAPNFQRINIALKEIVALEHVDDLALKLFHETAVQLREVVHDLAEFLQHNLLNETPVFENSENLLENRADLFSIPLKLRKCRTYYQ